MWASNIKGTYRIRFTSGRNYSGVEENCEKLDQGKKIKEHDNLFAAWGCVPSLNRASETD